MASRLCTVGTRRGGGGGKSHLGIGAIRKALGWPGREGEGARTREREREREHEHEMPACLACLPCLPVCFMSGRTMIHAGRWWTTIGRKPGDRKRARRDGLPACFACPRRALSPRRSSSFFFAVPVSSCLFVLFVPHTRSPSERPCLFPWPLAQRKAKPSPRAFFFFLSLSLSLPRSLPRSLTHHTTLSPVTPVLLCSAAALAGRHRHRYRRLRRRIPLPRLRGIKRTAAGHGPGKSGWWAPQAGAAR